MQTGRQVDKQTGRWVDRQTGRQVDSQTVKQVYRQTGRQENMKTGRQVDRQTGNIEIFTDYKAGDINLQIAKRLLAGRQMNKLHEILSC